MQGDTNHVRELEHADVSRVHFQGGSILNTSRANPTKKPEDLQRVVEILDRLGVGYLATIGGDDTMFAASQVARHAQGRIRVCHVPKTIDNDLPLPGETPTFGFETARQLGSDLVQNLMEDSRTTGRWYFVVVMGRSVGHLALGIGKVNGRHRHASSRKSFPVRFASARCATSSKARCLNEKPYGTVQMESP
jgi:6-phosphofructokinase 1